MTKKQIALLQIIVIYIITAISGYYSWRYFQNKFDMIPAFLFADVVMTVVIFLFSTIKKNSSVYDAYWSVLPFYFVLAWISLMGNQIGPDILVIFALISFWSWRLTLNWVRSWSDFTHEDWRYVNLAKQTGKLYPLVNFLGIHLFPTVMVFACLLPVFYVVQNPVGHKIWIYAGMAISFIGVLFELFADNQLAKFKNRLNPKKDDILNTGLWAKCRNPNYLGEILFWVGLAITGIGYQAPWYAYIGVVSLTFMFVFISIPMKEERMLEKRPDTWKKYKEDVGMLLPF